VVAVAAEAWWQSRRWRSRRWWRSSVGSNRNRNHAEPDLPTDLVLLLLALAVGAGSACRSASPAGFATPEAALHEFADTIGSHDQARAERLWGRTAPSCSSPATSRRRRGRGARAAVHPREDRLRGTRRDDAHRAARQRRLAVRHPARASERSLALRRRGWPRELANRRIGRNELEALATLHEVVDAQREYAAEEHDGAPRTFARTIFSTPGKHDGLYWPTAEGEKESPLGPLVAEAASVGYTHSEDEIKPYHGYYFRVLLEQGKNAPGGAKSFVDAQGRMTRGFAMLAWPAKYDMSGVMTFQVNQQGVVYQRDLGENTEKEVERIRAFDPDTSWDPTGD
jgi:hypothetical protein